jgi:hypothetical protein
MRILPFTLLLGCNGVLPQDDKPSDWGRGDDTVTHTPDKPPKVDSPREPGVHTVSSDVEGWWRTTKRKGPAPGLLASQCSGLTEGGPVAGPGCVTAPLRCGETIVGHTRGGGKNFNNVWYEESTCWPNTRNHNGGDERLYRFDPNAHGIPGRFWANFWLDTPCEQHLDLTVFRTTDKNSCPTEFTPNCDTVNPNTKANKTRRFYRAAIDPGEIWYVLIEGADDVEGAFALTMECELGG